MSINANKQPPEEPQVLEGEDLQVKGLKAKDLKGSESGKLESDKPETDKLAGAEKPPDGQTEIHNEIHNDNQDETQKASNRVAAKSARNSQLDLLLTLGLWFGLVVGFLALGFLIFTSVTTIESALLILGGVGIMFGLCGAAVLMHNTSINQIKEGHEKQKNMTLGGVSNLTSAKIIEKILDTDTEARLVARRDGIVVFANQKYKQIAEEAGVGGFSGVPPRIERLFSQQGAEAMKIFKLCRAARSGEPMSEDVYQIVALPSGTKRRRYEVSVNPIANDETHVTWNLRALTDDEEEHDFLAVAYSDYVRPVFAMEKSGQITWTNGAMREKLGVAKGSIHHIDDVVLGETQALVNSLWELDFVSQAARVRRKDGDPIDASFVSFLRGGTGEGFVCVELAPEDEVPEEALSLSGDITEAPFGVAIIQGEFGKDAKLLEANKSFTEVFGGASRNVLCSKLFPAETIEELTREVKRKTTTGGAQQIIEARSGEGAQERVFALYVKPVSRRRGSYGTRRTLLFSVDITERKRMEVDYGQDQKLKAIGNLAGEVAHDFNNFLQTILGNCDLLMMKHPVGDDSYAQLVVIRENSQRLANLTKQLLAFSRKQTMKRTVLSVTELLRDFTKFLDRAVGEKVKLELVNGRGLKPVKVDQNQLESSIMNLAVNARDAMGADGGRLTLTTRHVPMEEIIEKGFTELSHQDHVMISIQDTGPGVPQDIIDKIFDPFFTTKDVGKGTGLGLSTVYGVIGQMGGAIYLDSEEGQGALFSIYLPAFEPEELVLAQEQANAGSTEVRDLTGNGRILVVEDEDAVRNFVVMALAGRGYEVVEACDGVDALEVIEEEGGEYFDLIISDIMMTEMDGPDFILAVHEKYAYHPRVIFMSGYAETAMRDQIDKIQSTGYLQKPFSAKDLASTVKDAVGAPLKP